MTTEKQYAPMHPALKAFLWIFGVLFLIVLLVGIWAGMKWYDADRTGHIQENGILTSYKEGRGIQGNYVAKVLELTQVAEMSDEAQLRLTEAVFGPDGRAGVQATWQWVQEQNPTANVSLYEKLSNIIDASRNKYANWWSGHLARCQAWNEMLYLPIDRVFYKFAGYPDKRVEEDFTIAKMCKAIDSAHSKKAFDTHTDNGVQLRPAKK